MSKKQLRLAHVHWGFPPIIGGVETHMAMMLPLMAKLGHRVDVLCGDFEGVPDKYDYEGVHIHRTSLMDLNLMFKKGVEGLEKDLEKLYTDFIEETKPDIIHTHNMHYFSKPHTKMLADVTTRKGLPLILTAHNVWDDVLFLELTRDIPWTHIISVSHYIEKELLGVGIDSRKCTVVHHGLDHHKFHPDVSTDATYKKYPQLKGRQVVFHPARMQMVKGCDVSIKAFNIIHKQFPDAMLVLAGTKNLIDLGLRLQKDIEYFTNLVKFYGLEDNVLIDVYSLEEMPGMYAASDVCMNPSTFQEPFGLTMLEAMATSKPMVVTRAGGMPEVIQDGINGFVVNIKDFEALAGQVCRLLANDDLRRRFGATGRLMVEQDFTKEIMTEHNIDVYRKVLS